MKILVSAYACLPNRGSEEGNGWNYIQHYAKAGHDVWCITQASNQTFIDEALQQHPVPNLHMQYVNIPQWINQANQTLPWTLGMYVYYLAWQHYAYRAAQALDRQIGFDWVHHATYGSLQLATEMWKLNKPLIFGPVGGGQEAPAAFKQYFYSAWRGEVMRVWVSRVLLRFNNNVRQSLHRAARVYATNLETFNLICRLGAKNPALLLDCSLPDEFFPGTMPIRTPSDGLRILWVGRIFPRKGLPLVLDALSTVTPDVNFHLTIVGDGTLGVDLPQWIEQYGLQDNVTWQKQIPWQDVKQAYATHDVFMFCSLRDSSPMQILEAMAYGLPIVTLNLHGAGQMVSDQAGIKVPAICPDDTVAGLAEAIARLYHNPDLRQQMGQSAYAEAQQHNWSAKMATVLNDIETLQPIQTSVWGNDLLGYGAMHHTPKGS